MKTFVIELLFIIKIVFSLRIEPKIEELSSKISDKEIDDLLNLFFVVHIFHITHW